ncbi:hypothetical protein AVEN_261387-1 [Araneus ventricosus]|uniref:Uncharacterized protein n=1 Tax=Araneus ventricosus TaxID=182803 RepID=A0A4Y2PD56_ARAVE|nr:hypothetical protein AVEN_261387-1 [Araneus ventricosus]
MSVSYNGQHLKSLVLSNQHVQSDFKLHRQNEEANQGTKNEDITLSRGKERSVLQVWSTHARHVSNEKLEGKRGFFPKKNSLEAWSKFCVEYRIRKGYSYWPHGAMCNWCKHLIEKFHGTVVSIWVSYFDTGEDGIEGKPRSQER